MLKFFILLLLSVLAVSTTTLKHHNTNPAALTPSLLVTRTTRLRAAADLKEGCVEIKTQKECLDADCRWAASAYGGSCFERGSYYQSSEYQEGDEIRAPKEPEVEEKNYPRLLETHFTEDKLANKEFADKFKGKTKEELEAVKEYPVFLLGAGFNGNVFIGSKDAFQDDVKKILKTFNPEEPTENILIKIAKGEVGIACLQKEIGFYPLAAQNEAIVHWIPKYEGIIRTTKLNGEGEEVPSGYVLVLKYLAHSQPMDRFAVNRDYQGVLSEQWLHLSRSLVVAVEKLHDNEFQHNDLKPENVLIYSHGRQLHLKVMDFGTATSKEDNSYIEFPPIYPPQAAGSRVYSSGACNAIYPKWSIWQSEVSEELGELLKRGLIDAPEKRIEHAAQSVLTDLYSVAGLLAWNLFWSNAPLEEYDRLASLIKKYGGRFSAAVADHFFWFLREMGIRAKESHLAPVFKEWGVNHQVAEELAEFIKLVVDFKTIDRQEIWEALRKSKFYTKIIEYKPIELPEGFHVPDIAKIKFLESYLPKSSLMEFPDSSQLFEPRKGPSSYIVRSHSHHKTITKKL